MLQITAYMKHCEIMDNLMLSTKILESQINELYKQIFIMKIKQKQNKVDRDNEVLHFNRDVILCKS